MSPRYLVMSTRYHIYQHFFNRLAMECVSLLLDVILILECTSFLKQPFPCICYVKRALTDHTLYHMSPHDQNGSPRYYCSLQRGDGNRVDIL